MKVTSFPAKLQQRIDAHLDAIDRVLAESGLPSHDRVAIVGEVEHQVREILADRCPGGAAPSIADVEAVLSELDPPESYADRDAQASIAAPSPSPIAGRVSLGMTLVGFALVIAMMIIAAGVEQAMSLSAFRMMAMAAMLIFPLAFVCGLIGWRSTSGKLVRRCPACSACLRWRSPFSAPACPANPRLTRSGRRGRKSERCIYQEAW